MTFKKPLGTIDFYPEDKNIQNQVFNSLRNTAKNFGFNEVETPAFETIDLLCKKSGEEVTDQIFVLEQKGKEKFGLRFDLTVPITRLFLDKQKEIPKPVKWFALSRMWRYERPQAGRLREFYQLSVEMFGANTPESDAEIINLAIKCLTDLGLTKEDFSVRLNNRKLLQGIIEQYFPKENIEKVISLVDKKEKLEEKDFDKGLKDFGVSDIKEFKKILETQDLSQIDKNNLNDYAKEGLKELKEITNFIDNDFIKINLSTARGLAYYTGTVFELFDNSGKFRALAGGGRYDNLIKLFGGEPCPATGFGIGYSTLNMLLKEKGLLKKANIGPDYYIAIIGDISNDAIKIINKLREKYSVDYDISKKNFKKQLNYANSISAKNLIVIGEDEIKNQIVKIKDMKTGKEKEIKISDL